MDGRGTAEPLRGCGERGNARHAGLLSGSDVYHGFVNALAPAGSDVTALTADRRRCPAAPCGLIRCCCIMGSGTSASQLSVC